jgi:hypothetical protein
LQLPYPDSGRRSILIRCSTRGMNMSGSGAVQLEAELRSREAWASAQLRQRPGTRRNSGLCKRLQAPQVSWSNSVTQTH